MHYDFREKIATVKLVDLGKYLYEQQKAKKEKKKKQQKKGLKQLKFGYSIGDNDLQLKVKKSQEFLEDGHDVKITVRLR
jgi:translation initiation factor IF-3